MMDDRTFNIQTGDVQVPPPMTVRELLAWSDLGPAILRPDWDAIRRVDTMSNENDIRSAGCIVAKYDRSLTSCTGVIEDGTATLHLASAHDSKSKVCLPAITACLVYQDPFEQLDSAFSRRRHAKLKRAYDEVLAWCKDGEIPSMGACNELSGYCRDYLVEARYIERIYLQDTGLRAQLLELVKTRNLKRISDVGFITDREPALPPVMTDMQAIIDQATKAQQTPASIILDR